MLEAHLVAHGIDQVVDPRLALVVSPGQPASLVLWSPGTGQGSGGLTPDRLPDLAPGATLPTNLRTVIRGRTVFDLEGVS